MENKINISELIKNCPKGMELDCTMFEKPVKYMGLTKNETYIIAIKTSCDKFFLLTKEGYLYDTPDSRCVIFPKGKTTWEGFVPPCQFKDGDIIFTHANCLKVGVGNTWISIFKERRNSGVATYVDYAEDGSDYYSDLDGDKALLCMESDILRQRFATEEEKEKLFKAIEDNGYEWNAETKTLEYLIKPKFKPGDKIRSKNKKDEYFHILHVDEDKHKYVLNIKGYCLEFKDQDHYELTNEPKFKVGDRIRKKGDKTATFTISDIGDLCYYCGGYVICNICYQDDYELVPNKFDISTLKPFESRVLVRDKNTDEWRGHFFSHYDNNSDRPYICIGLEGINEYNQCIPYEENKYLLGKTDDCIGFYKTWE